MPRILLIGQGPTALSALQSLAPRFEIVGIVRRCGADDTVARAAVAAGIPRYEDTSLKAIDRRVASAGADCVVVSSYDRIIGWQTLARCRFVNVHYAPLPAYRGRATVNWALINGESSTAITIHELVPQLDGGPILFQRTVSIGPDDTVATLYETLNAIQREALGATVAAFLEGARGQAQDPSAATYGCTRLPDDGEIDWTASTATIDRLVRALAPPFPGAFTHLNGDRLVVRGASKPADAPHFVGRVPGRVVQVSKIDGSVDVLTGDGVLRLHEVQIAGQPVTTPAALIRSVKTTLGVRAADLLDRIAALETRLAALEAPVDARGRRLATPGADHARSV